MWGFAVNLMIMGMNIKKHWQDVIFPALFLLLLILYLGIAVFPWSTLPGTGLNSTSNMLTWIWCAVFALCFIPVIWRRTIRRGNNARYLLIGSTLMSLPLLWTPAEMQLGALYRLLGLWALAGFLLLLIQYPIRGDQRRAIYALLIFASVVQTALALGQVLVPEWLWKGFNYDFIASEGRPLGSFKQVNILASFLATGLLCAVWLRLSGSDRHRTVLNFSALFITVGLVFTQSRSMWLAALLGVGIIMLISPAPGRVRHTTLVVLVIGIAAGKVGLQYRPDSLISTQENHPVDVRPMNTQARLDWNKRQSTNERIYLAKGAWELIKTSPLQGHGLNSFETAFPQALNRAGTANPFTVTVTHPHNEVLFVWAEGGISALAGLLLWGMVFAQPFKTFFSTPRWRVIARGTLMLPLVAHVMSEYPLYMSAVHGVTLMVLLWLSLPARNKKNILPGQSFARNRFVLGGAILCSICTIGFMATGLKSSEYIREAEQFSLRYSPPLYQMSNVWAQPERLEFDRAVNALAGFSATRRTEWLAVFQRNAARWLMVHNDANLMNSMLQVVRFQKDSEAEKYWQKRACLSFPHDERFACRNTSSFNLGE